MIWLEWRHCKIWV